MLSVLWFNASSCGLTSPVIISQQSSSLHLIVTPTRDLYHNSALKKVSMETSRWKVNKLVVKSLYIKLMIAAGFFTEVKTRAGEELQSLGFENKQTKEVLMIGLGGGVLANFLSALEINVC